MATQLFQNYETAVDQGCRILHIPTVRSLIKNFYLRMHQGDPVNLGHAALVLSILAISAYFYAPFENSKVATTQQDASSLSTVLCKAALDVLDHSRRNTSGCLEDIQANILMSFVTYHLDGFSARGRMLTTSATAIARDLRLHRLDDDNSQNEKDVSVRELIDREVKRRVFWHIAATDW